MSLLIIKQELENYLNTNMTTIAIKWRNTSVFTLNSVNLTPVEVDALTVYIEPRIIPIQSPRELISTTKGVNYQTFFQVSVFIKSNGGTGNAYTIANAINGLFRDANLNGVVCESVETLTDFELNEWVIFPVRVLARTWGN